MASSARRSRSAGVRGGVVHRAQQFRTQAPARDLAEAVANDFPDQRMGEVDLRGAGLVEDADQAAPLDVLEGVGGDQFGHDRQGQRFGECQQLQCAFLVGGQPV